jgi:hypothetical protein
VSMNSDDAPLSSISVVDVSFMAPLSLNGLLDCERTPCSSSGGGVLGSGCAIGRGVVFGCAIGRVFGLVGDEAAAADASAAGEVGDDEAAVADASAAAADASAAAGGAGDGDGGAEAMTIAAMGGVVSERVAASLTAASCDDAVSDCDAMEGDVV